MFYLNISCQTFSIQRILKSDSSQNKMSLMSCNTICMEHLSCYCGDECLMMIFSVNNNGNLNYSGKVISIGMKVNLLLSVSSSRSYFNFRIQILVATRYPGCDNNTKTSLSMSCVNWKCVQEKSDSSLNFTPVLMRSNLNHPGSYPYLVDFPPVTFVNFISLHLLAVFTMTKVSYNNLNRVSKRDFL